MSKTVTARSGDSLCNIAYLNGFSDCKLLREEAANAYIVNRTEEPGQVLPGDVVTIPDYVEHTEAGATELTHNFVKRGNLAMLRFVHKQTAANLSSDPSLRFLNVSNYITDKAGTGDGNAAFPGTADGNFNAEADKDQDAFKIEILDLKASGDLTAELEVLRPTYNAAGRVVGHVQFPTAIRPARQLRPTAFKQGSTQLRRTPYLRLVVDEKDKAAAANQTLLTSDIFDPADATTKQVEILDQQIKASYTIASCSQNPKCKSTVELPIGEDRRRMRLAVHVLNNRPSATGGTPVVPLADVERRVFTWFRRVYAQANIAPKLMLETRAVDPPANLVSISNDSGLRANGDGQIGFTISAAGKPTQVVGPISPARSDRPIKTAQTLAALVTTPYRAAVSENPARFVDIASLKSADIVITEESGARVTITIDVPLANRDTGQTIDIGAANPMNLLSWAVPRGNNNWNAGSIEQRTVLKNHDTGDDRVDIFVAHQLSAGNRGEAMMSNHLVDPARSSISQVKWSAFLAAHAMNAGDGNPFSFPHEVGHVAAEVVHATASRNQLMTGGGTSETNAVGGTKRIRDDAVHYDSPPGDFNIVSRLRAAGSPLLEGW